jgi:hypothetical protein
MTTDGNRFGLAMVLVPLSVPAILLILSVAQSGFSTDAIGPWGLTIFAVVTFVSYFGLLLLGIPAYFFLRRINKLRLWSLCIAGAVGAVIVGLVIRIGFEDGYTKPFSLVEDAGRLVLFAGLGVVVATIFGLITRIPFK